MVFLFKLLHGACLRKKLLLDIVTLFHQMQFNLKCCELESQSQQVTTICLRFTCVCVSVSFLLGVDGLVGGAELHTKTQRMYLVLQC